MGLKPKANCAGLPADEKQVLSGEPAGYPTGYRLPRERVEAVRRRVATRLCPGCPLRVECHDAWRGETGVWGGRVVSEQEQLVVPVVPLRTPARQRAMTAAVSMSRAGASPNEIARVLDKTPRTVFRLLADARMDAEANCG